MNDEDNETTSMHGEEQTMMDQIVFLGEQIKAAKSSKQPKEIWDPLLQEMLTLKNKFKQMFGKDYVAPGVDTTSNKNDKTVVTAATTTTTTTTTTTMEASDKNKEKREKKAAEKAAREAEKEAKRAERQQREREKAERVAAASTSTDNFGDMPMLQSQVITNRQWTALSQLTPALVGQSVLVRGHLQTVRAVGKGVFVLLRSSLYSVQGVAFEGKNKDKDNCISMAMIKYIAALPAESVVDMEGLVTVPQVPVESATQKWVEIQMTAFHAVCKAKQALPFVMEDACRPDAERETDIGEYLETDEAATAAVSLAAAAADGVQAHVGQKMRLDYRWLDLRTPANQAIFRIESMVGCLFRECLLKKEFVEVHTPKIIGGASEGGSDVFTLDYFGQPACLAMSPQLHKQMAAACSGFERVFTTGPVFRAENSNTRRHLCEFTGFDLEMTIHEHYDEVLDVFSDLFLYIFDGINERCKAELERVREQHPFEDLKYLRPTLKLTYAEGCALLREAGVSQNDLEDLSTENEKKLGDVVSTKYGTDFFFMDKYPLSVRPFYTMPDPHNAALSNSYDFFIRGQEILSGAQRIHEPDLLEQRATAHGINLADIEAYVNSFRHGAMPHGGGGIGLERVVMLFLGLPNIRKTSWFPRDPKRIAP